MGKCILYLVILVLFFGCKETEVPYKKDTTTIHKGAATFNQYCASCHNFENNSIGPNLSGITNEVQYNWLYAFIQNPQKLIEAKDKRSTELLAKYKLIMPSFPQLSKTEIEGLLAFLHTKDQRVITTKIKGNKIPLEDPIAERIEKNGNCIALDFYLQAPATASSKPLARINKLTPISSENKRIFLSDLNGILYEIKSNTLEKTLNLQDYFPHFITKPGLASGLGSFAFHPDYANNGLFYTTHTEDPKQAAKADFSYHDSIPKKMRWILTEWKNKKPSNPSFKGSHRKILSVDIPTQVHGIQEISFNTSVAATNSDYGNLYICIGDGGSAENKFLHLTQSNKKIWGTILRIDPLGNNSENGNYGIPADNPFANTPNTLSEIWAYGFRNPNRISWDNQSGKLLASDIGHRQIEEINLIEPGKNYGWPMREGTFTLIPLESMEDIYNVDTTFLQKYADPVLQFDHDDSNAVCGGYVYQGKNIPALKGKYIFGGIVHGKIYAATVSELELGKQSKIEEFDVCYMGKTTSLKEISKTNRVDFRLGIDGDGELYVFTKADGKIYKVATVH
ncbi:PQQ-dependent sugar dehydrogenase [Cellulophaga sp. F20128]|uniref:PQQ-dependent sugar dehydrogenase n=1 Tax=Cellulophaga sp. F20128 TaxID=2926413 RepID=UPI001FF21B18|nr:PQQ-dependent sugar dehydrogenase [Cellulophaga sp. F20128]MCK0155862.1 PQQ-dependent sugar dehydrogenase [Cellulophaga sp. F20128]